MNKHELTVLESLEDEWRELEGRAAELLARGLPATERRLLAARFADAERAMVTARHQTTGRAAESEGEAEKVLRVLFHALWHIEQKGPQAPGDSTAVGSTRPVSLLARSLERRRRSAVL